VALPVAQEQRDDDEEIVDIPGLSRRRWPAYMAAFAIVGIGAASWSMHVGPQAARTFVEQRVEVLLPDVPTRSEDDARVAAQAALEPSLQVELSGARAEREVWAGEQLRIHRVRARAAKRRAAVEAEEPSVVLEDTPEQTEPAPQSGPRPELPGELAPASDAELVSN
jgi:hypothetical protein